MKKLIFGGFLISVCVANSVAQDRALDWSDSRQSISTRYSADLAGAVTQSGNAQGTMRDNTMDAHYQLRVPLTDRLTGFVGGGYRRTDLFLTGGAPLPNVLQSLNFRVGGEWKFNERWNGGASVSPGIYGDTDLDRRDNFKAPVSFFARYSSRPGLIFIGGLAVGSYGRRGVTPFVGVIWQIDERWRLSAVPPVARLAYRIAGDQIEPVSLFLGVGFDGGRYQVAPDFGNRFNKPELNGNTLSVQQGDVQTGVNAAWTFLTGELGVGYRFARKYRYEQAAETFDVHSEPYLSASVRARF